MLITCEAARSRTGARDDLSVWLQDTSWHPDYSYQSALSVLSLLSRRRSESEFDYPRC